MDDRLKDALTSHAKGVGPIEPDLQAIEHRGRRRRTMRFGLTGMLAVALAAGVALPLYGMMGFGDPAAPVVPADPPPNALEVELFASCGGVRFGQLPPDTSSLEPFTAFDELDMSRVGGEAPFLLEFAQGYDWVVTQEGQDWRQLFGEPVEPGADPPYASLRIELRDGRWAPVGWGQCRIELEAEGWGNAGFVVDPETPPDPVADLVTVLATENACAGGMAPEGRDVRAVILEENEDAVSIVILVEPRGGDCPSNPAFAFEVELGSPLGDREILDASVYPPEVRWP